MTFQRSPLASACLIASSALLAGCSTTPANTMATASAATNTSAGDQGANKSVATLVDNGLRCRRVQATGTHMFKKICTTAAQRQKMKEEAELLGRDGKRMADAARAHAQAAREAARETFR